MESSSGASEPSIFKREISRWTTILCRGVKVRRRDGHFDSQNPHSMHLYTSDETNDKDFKWVIWVCGSVLMITPGLSMPAGSNNDLRSRMMAYAVSPHSVSTKGAMLRPVPCSALSAPSYLPLTS